ncbi:MAG: hypothetical protein OXG44_11880 [Gammaproteobacteria bacterium]|nr:hypothetical protein [Gammaproteobacteria bacterium]
MFSRMPGIPMGVNVWLQGSKALLEQPEDLSDARWLQGGTDWELTEAEAMAVGGVVELAKRYHGPPGVTVWLLTDGTATDTEPTQKQIDEGKVARALGPEPEPDSEDKRPVWWLTGAEYGAVQAVAPKTVPYDRTEGVA